MATVSTSPQPALEVGQLWNLASSAMGSIAAWTARCPKTAASRKYAVNNVASVAFKYANKGTRVPAVVATAKLWAFTHFCSHIT